MRNSKYCTERFFINIQQSSKPNNAKDGSAKDGSINAKDTSILLKPSLFMQKIRVKQIFLLCLLNYAHSVYGAVPQSVTGKSAQKQRDIVSTSLSGASYYIASGAKLFEYNKFLSYPAISNLITPSIARGNNNSSNSSNNNNINKKFQKLLNNKKNIKTDIIQGIISQSNVSQNNIGQNNTGFGNQVNFNSNNLQSQLANSGINSLNADSLNANSLNTYNSQNASDKKTKLIEGLKNKLAASQSDFFFKTKLSEMLSDNHPDGSLHDLEGSDLLNNALELILAAVEEADTNNNINSNSIDEAIKVVASLLDEKNIQENISSQDLSNNANKDTDNEEDKKNELLEKMDEILTWSDRIVKAETAIKHLTGVIDYLRMQYSGGQSGVPQTLPLQPASLPTPVLIPTSIPTSAFVPSIPSSFSLQANANLNVIHSSDTENDKNKKTTNGVLNTAKDNFVQTDNNVSATTSNISSDNMDAHYTGNYPNNYPNGYPNNYPIANSSEKLSLRPAFSSLSHGTFAKLPPVPPHGLGTPLSNTSFGPAHTPAHNTPAAYSSRHGSGHGSLLSTPASNNITSNSQSYKTQLSSNQLPNMLTGIGSAYTNNSRFETNANSISADFVAMKHSENTSANTTPSNSDKVDPIIEFIDPANSNSNDYNSSVFNSSTFIPSALMRNNAPGNNAPGNNTLIGNSIDSGFGKVSNVGGISGRNNRANGLNTLGGNTSGGVIRSGNIISGGGIGGHGTVIRPRIVGSKGPTFLSSQSSANSNSNPAIKNALLSRILGNQALNNTLNSTVNNNIAGNNMTASNMNVSNMNVSNAIQSGVQNLPLSRAVEPNQSSTGHRQSIVQFDTLRNTIVQPDRQDSSDDNSTHAPISRENTEERLGSDNTGSDDNLGNLNNAFYTAYTNFATNNSVRSDSMAGSLNSVSLSPKNAVIPPKVSTTRGPAFIPPSQHMYAPGSGDLVTQNNVGNQSSNGKGVVKKVIKGSKGPVF